jgi:hypothetical protein
MLEIPRNFESWCYFNLTPKVQIIRSQISNWYLERTIFPNQQFCFNAPPEAQLEILNSSEVSMILSDRILCKNLKPRPSTIP